MPPTKSRRQRTASKKKCGVSDRLTSLGTLLSARDYPAGRGVFHPSSSVRVLPLSANVFTVSTAKVGSVRPPTEPPFHSHKTKTPASHKQPGCRALMNRRGSRTESPLGAAGRYNLPSVRWDTPSAPPAPTNRLSTENQFPSRRPSQNAPPIGLSRHESGIAPPKTRPFGRAGSDWTDNAHDRPARKRSARTGPSPVCGERQSSPAS